MDRSVAKGPLLGAGTAAAVFLASAASYSLAVGGVSTVWFPSGVTLAFLLLTSAAGWVWVLAGTFLGNAVADLTMTDPGPLWILGPVINVLEGVLAASVVRRLAGARSLVATLRGAAALVVGAAVLANALTALAGGGFLTLAYQGAFGGRWLTWWIGDGLGMLVTAPAILALAELLRPPGSAPAVRRQLVEGGLFAAAAVVVLAASFNRPGDHNPALSALIFPLLMVAALRQGIVAHLLVTLASVMALYFSSLGQGPLVEASLSGLQGAVQILAYLGLASTSTLVLSAVIAERQNAERQVRASESRYRALVGAAHDGIVTVDGRGRIRLASQSMGQILGTDPEALVGRPIADIFSPSARAALAAALEAGAPGAPSPSSHTVELAALGPDGGDVPVEVGIGAGHDDAGPFTTLIVRDIGDRLKAEQQREQLQSQLNQAQRMEAVGRLTGGIAHDFNNMLTVISGHADLALDAGGPGSPVFDHLCEIRAAADHSTHLTRQLLGFARRQVIAPRTLELNKTVEGTLGMLRALVGDDVVVRWAPAGGLWPVHLDPTQVQQVLLNLCANARDAVSGTGTVLIETANVTFDESYCSTHAGFSAGDFVMLAVTDDGTGMDEATLAHAFEPFFTTKEHGEGTGLGLASVFGIAKQNDGFLNLYSELGKGTTVKLYVPRLVGESEAPLPPPAAALPVPPAEGVILLVDDNLPILNLTRATLERIGYRVVAAESAEEALRAAEEMDAEIGLLVTDVVLPGLNGRELAERLQRKHPGLAVLYTSGYTENVIVQRGILKAGVSFLPKPYTRGDLAARVQAAWPGKASS